MKSLVVLFTLLPLLAVAVPQHPPPNQAIVKMSPGAGPPEAVLADLADRGVTFQHSRWNRGAVLVSGISLEEIAAIRGRSGVLYAEPNYEYEVQEVQEYIEQPAPWDANTTSGWNILLTRCRDAWPASRGQGIVVAVLDTGIVPCPDLDANLWTNPGEIPGDGIDNDANGFIDDIHGWNFAYTTTSTLTDGHGHGTHVSGTLGARQGNGIGVAGGAPDVTILVVKGLTDIGFGSTWDLANGIEYASRYAKILSNSWGSKLTNTNPSWFLLDAFELAQERGCISFCAAGNNGGDADRFMPANFTTTVSVAACSPDVLPTWFTNRGKTVDFSCPGGKTLYYPPYGGNILSTAAEGSYLWINRINSHVDGGGIPLQRLEGSSMATPLCAAIAALIWSAHPEYSAAQVLLAMRATALDAGDPGRDDVFGWGIPQADAAIAFYAPPDTTPLPTFTPSPTPTPTTSATATPSLTPTVSLTPTPSPTVSPTLTPSLTPSPSPSPSVSPTASPTPTISPTSSPSLTPSETPTPIPTRTLPPGLQDRIDLPPGWEKKR